MEERTKIQESNPELINAQPEFQELDTKIINIESKIEAIKSKFYFEQTNI